MKRKSKISSNDGLIDIHKTCFVKVKAVKVK